MEHQERLKEEEERMRREEEEKERQLEEIRLAKEEKERQEKERKQRMREKKAEKVARQKAEGTYLTPKQKEELARARAKLEAMGTFSSHLALTPFSLSVLALFYTCRRLIMQE